MKLDAKHRVVFDDRGERRAVVCDAGCSIAAVGGV
jgi:hypothetical protein